VSTESADVEISLDGKTIATTVPYGTLPLLEQHLRNLEVVDEGIRIPVVIAIANSVMAATATAVFLAVYKP
jgi:hypothetical protein